MIYLAIDTPAVVSALSPLVYGSSTMLSMALYKGPLCLWTFLSRTSEILVSPSFLLPLALMTACLIADLTALVLETVVYFDTFSADLISRLSSCFSNLSFSWISFIFLSASSAESCDAILTATSNYFWVNFLAPSGSSTVLFPAATALFTEVLS